LSYYEFNLSDLANSHQMKLPLYLSQLLALTIGVNSALAESHLENRLLPKDFQIVATFGSRSVGAHGQVIGWKLLLTAEGKASQEAYFLPDSTRRKNIRVSKDALARIARHVREANFFALPAHLEADAFDVPAYILEVTMDGRSHRVRVYGPAFLTRKAALRRFTDVWASLVEVVPSPNNNSELSHLRANI
jgi:hypothetical protein